MATGYRLCSFPVDGIGAHLGMETILYEMIETCSLRYSKLLTARGRGDSVNREGILPGEIKTWAGFCKCASLLGYSIDNEGPWEFFGLSRDVESLITREWVEDRAETL